MFEFFHAKMFGEGNKQRLGGISWQGIYVGIWQITSKALKMVIAFESSIILKGE